MNRTNKLFCLLLLVLLALMLYAPAMADSENAVGFIYHDLQYIMPVDSSAPLSDILNALGLRGEVTAVEVNDEALFFAYNANEGWIVNTRLAFSTTE